MKLSEITFKINGKLTGIDQNVAHFRADSRECGRGDLFFAIRGERHDGHDFVEDIYKKGGYAVTEHEIPFSPYISVENSKRALIDLAVAKVGSVFKIAITGSNGKTTTKEILSKLLEKHGKVLRTEGNFNTDIGISLSLLNGVEEPQFCVIEMGAQHPGEIERLSSIFPPDISVITSIGSAHSAFIDVAKEKSSIAIHTKLLVIHDGNSRLGDFGKKGKLYTESVKLDGYTDMNTLISFNGKPFILRGIWGEGQIKDLNMALSVIDRMNLNWNIEDLEKIILPDGRLKVEKIERYFIADDTYNASPESLFNSVQTVSRLGKAIWILAPMRELKDENLQKRLREIFEKFKPKHVFTFSNEENFYPFGEPYDFMKLLEILEENDFILVKGSRFYEMEKIVDEIKGGLKKLNG